MAFGLRLEDLWELAELGVPIGASILGTPALGIAAAGAMGGLGAGIKGKGAKGMLAQAALGAGTSALGSGFGKAIGGLGKTLGKGAAKGAGKAAQKAAERTLGATLDPTVGSFAKSGLGLQKALEGPAAFQLGMKYPGVAAGESAGAMAKWLERVQMFGNFMDVAEQGQRRWDEIVRPRREMSFPQAPIQFPERRMGLDYDPNRFMRGYSGRW